MAVLAPMCEHNSGSRLPAWFASDRRSSVAAIRQRTRVDRITCWFSGHTGGMKRDIELEATLVAKYAVVEPVLDERSRRRWAAAESARHRLRRRRGGFVGYWSGSGDDSQGTPGDYPRRGADGPHPTPWRRTAPHPAGSTRHPGRARSGGGPAHARRPDLANMHEWCRYPSSPWQKSRIRPGPGAAEPRRLHGMAMGKRPVARQASPLWVETADLPTSDGHPFFARLNRVLEDCGFDAFVEGLCSAFYAARMGRPSLRPGRYFRMLLIGYFEGLSSERGIAWRVADSLSLRSFLDLELTESVPDHSTLSRTRRLIDVETHEAVVMMLSTPCWLATLAAGLVNLLDSVTLPL